MRFATIEATVEGPINGLEAFVAAQGLDLLNLRYRRARVVNPTGEDWVYPDFNQSFATHLGQLTKSLYLEPNLHVFADAGWGNAYGCVEAAAAKLVDAGCGDLLISAVRGSNLLPMLDQLYFEGQRFEHEANGEGIDLEHHKLLAADLQIGAGPIEAAFAEGARVVIAGCCDPTASVIAKAANQYDWQWDELERIAGAAAAAELTHELSHRRSLTSQSVLPVVVGSVAHEGNFTVGIDARDGAGEIAELRTRPLLSTADVNAEWSDVEVSEVSPSLTNVSGVAGAASDGTWRLSLIHARFATTMELVFRSREVAADFLSSLPAEIPNRAQAPTTPVAGCYYEMLPQRSEKDACSYLIRLLGDDQMQCESWLNLFAQKVAQVGPYVTWISAPPQVQAVCEAWPTRIPRDQIDIAVDTRPAKEWF
ncbi:MAG: acyclic terpene utilization AtuA family protein [Lacipirellulaceae bacterium]